ncbi:MAG: helix-turn-helix domain-containing protein [Candidatus Uhrbacteria bacterium]|nr:helix-turn-helix domain-containing protein [Candidatus Uhrbacteria bacterium]
MTTPSILHELGLSQHEASIYLALLEIGTGTVTEIAEKARVKRPTAYLVLGELGQKGFVSIVPHPKKLIYTSSGPDALLSYANERRRHLLDIMPHLESLHAQSKDKPRVRFFDGVKSVSSYYQTIAYPNDEIDFFASISSVVAHPDIPLIHELPGYKKKKIREILTPSKEDIEYARKILPLGSLHEIKVLPKNSEWMFKTDNILTPGKVGITSLTKKVFVVLIEDADVYASYRTLFDLAWQSAIPVQKYLR